MELLTSLIDDYESRVYAMPECQPNELLAFLLEQRGLKPSDLWPVIGSRGRVSEILSGKRRVSRDQAKTLADFFHVRADLFL